MTENSFLKDYLDHIDEQLKWLSELSGIIFVLAIPILLNDMDEYNHGLLAISVSLLFMSFMISSLFGRLYMNNVLSDFKRADSYIDDLWNKMGYTRKVGNSLIILCLIPLYAGLVIVYIVLISFANEFAGMICDIIVISLVIISILLIYYSMFNKKNTAILKEIKMKTKKEELNN